MSLVSRGLVSDQPNQLIELYGEDARVFLLQCLVEETGFKEQRTHTHHGNKDTQKVRQSPMTTNFAVDSVLAFLL